MAENDDPIASGPSPEEHRMDTGVKDGNRAVGVRDNCVADEGADAKSMRRWNQISPQHGVARVAAMLDEVNDLCSANSFWQKPPVLSVHTDEAISGKSLVGKSVTLQHPIAR